MSKNIIEITQSDSIPKDSLPEKEIISERNITNLKVLCGAKKIALISLLIFLIVTLFISCAYLLLCQNKKSSLNLDELRNEKRRTPLLDSQNKQQTISPSSRSLASPANSVTGYERNILLVTNYISKKGHGRISGDALYNLLNQIKKVTITILDPYDENLSSKGINYLKKYHLVVIDFVDGGYNLSPKCPSFVKALMQ